VAEPPVITPGYSGWSATIETINNLTTVVNTTNNGGTGTVNPDYPGGLDPGAVGSALPVGFNFPSSEYSASYGATANSAWYWPSTSLTTGGGRLVASFETNAWAETSLQNNTSAAWIQNVYGLLSGCYHYQLTKAFTQPSLCVGQTGSFTLCVTNTGQTALPDLPLWDTIPGCLQYNSTSSGDGSLGPPAVNGNVYTWTIPNVPNTGVPYCLTVNFTVQNYAGCQ
jgi:uncharacterized repeat protein (TIGR01451 family)